MSEKVRLKSDTDTHRQGGEGWGKVAVEHAAGRVFHKERQPAIVQRAHEIYRHAVAMNIALLVLHPFVFQIVHRLHPVARIDVEHGSDREIPVLGPRITIAQREGHG